MFFAALQFILRIGVGRCCRFSWFFCSAIGNLQLICSLRLSARFPKWANADLSQIINASHASGGLLCLINVLTLKHLTSSTSEKTENYCSRKMIRAFVRSYGESSTETLSPGTIRIKCLRILPEICARTLRWPGRSTRNIVPGKTCVTVPSVMICSSFAIARRIYVPAHTAQG